MPSFPSRFQRYLWLSWAMAASHHVGLFECYYSDRFRCVMQYMLQIGGKQVGEKKKGIQGTRMRDCWRYPFMSFFGQMRIF